MDAEPSRLTDELPGLIWTALPDGRFDYVNRRWCAHTGQSVSEALGLGWQAAIHAEDLPEVCERWAEMLAGKPRDIEARLRRFDGTYRWFLFRTSTSTSDTGEIIKWYGIATDIEDRKFRSPYALDYRSRWWLSKLAREGHFRSIDDGIPTLAALLKPGAGVEHVNREALQYFGVAAEDLYEWITPDNVHPDDLSKVAAACQASDRSGAGYDIVARRRRSDGAYRWFQMRRFPLHDTEGNVYFWYLSETDIDDLKRAEALLAGEKRLLEMVAGGRPLSSMLEALGRLVKEAAHGCRCSVLFLDPNGRSWQVGAAPDLPRAFNDAMQGRPASDASGPGGLAILKKELVLVQDLATDPRWQDSGFAALAREHGLSSCWSSPIVARDGNPLGSLDIYRSVPGDPSTFERELIARLSHIASIAVERAHSETALRRSEAFLAEAQRLSLTGSFSWRISANEVTWSEQAHRILELDPTVAVNLERLVSRLHPEDVPSLLELIDRLRAGAGDFESEYRLRMPDLSIKFVHLVARGTVDQDGQIEYIGAVRDVTQNRLAEEALGKARSELAHMARVSSLGALTASIAHEVNQPLSGIITNTSTCLRMLAASPPNVDGARETARRTLRDGNRASEVISRLRALFAKTAVTTEIVDINDATREVLALSRSELLRSRVVVRLELAADLPPIQGDRIQLQQVILNLLLNASDAMAGVDDRPRQILIKTERQVDEGRVTFSIADCGVGVQLTDAERLFEPFYSTKPGGMGIGLSVSLSIIELHRGRLWVEPNTGPGAIFRFSVPEGPEQEPTQVASVPMSMSMSMSIPAHPGKKHGS